jgi:hypothetical protein
MFWFCVTKIVLNTHRQSNTIIQFAPFFATSCATIHVEYQIKSRRGSRIALRLQLHKKIIGSLRLRLGNTGNKSRDSLKNIGFDVLLGILLGSEHAIVINIFKEPHYFLQLQLPLIRLWLQLKALYSSWQHIDSF